MSIGFKHSKVRLTLLATMVAATSALVAGPVHAGKELPEVRYDGHITCAEVPGGQFQVEAAFRLENGKGKWAHVTSYVSVAGGKPKSVDYVATKVQLSDSITPDTVVEPGQSVEWTVELVNRKDTELGKSDTSAEITCPATP